MNFILPGAWKMAPGYLRGHLKSMFRFANNRIFSLAVKLPMLLLCTLSISTTSFAENNIISSGYKDLGDAFELLDKLETEQQTETKSETISKKPSEAIKADNNKTIPDTQSGKKTKPAVAGLDNILQSLTEPPAKENTHNQPMQKSSTTTESPSVPTTRRIAKVKKNEFSKRDPQGKQLAANADQWSCVEDAVTKLVWEVKTNDGSKRDKNHTFTWYSPDKDQTSGSANGGRCKGDVACDTHAYIEAINKQKLCGYSDWRLPTRKEMLSIVGQNASTKEARIDKSYFPQAMPSWYWTASSNEQKPEYAWYVLFRNGLSLNDLKERPKHIRLVRGGDSAFASAD